MMRYVGFLKWWYPTTMGFPTTNDDFGGVLGVPPFKEAPISTLQRTNIYPTWEREKKKENHRLKSAGWNGEMWVVFMVVHQLAT